MDANAVKINTVFGQNRRHVVPSFQRPYVWTREEQWEPLWADIRAVGDRIIETNAPVSHYLGAIVLDQVPNPYGHLETRLVIDGQQRLATIQVLLGAFSHLCAEVGAAEYQSGLVKLTRNAEPLPDREIDRFKVWPTHGDQEHFTRVMGSASRAELLRAYGRSPCATTVGHPIPDAYIFFYDALHTWLRPGEADFDVRLDALYAIVTDAIRLVVIDLDPDDDGQLVFENVNAHGTPLAPSALLKNRLLHRALGEGEDVGVLYSATWLALDAHPGYWRETVGAGHEHRAKIDAFMHHYLIAQSATEVPPSKLSAGLRGYAGSSAASAADDLRSVRTYADVYRSLDHLPPDSREARFIDRLNVMDHHSIRPFVLALFALHADDADLLHAILDDVESFLVRRMVCRLSAHAYGRLFAEVVAVVRSGTPNAVEGVRERLLAGQDPATRWPTDEEFRERWVTCPLYRRLTSDRMRMLLVALEEALRTDKTERLALHEPLTIEHLLPQRWNDDWALPADLPHDEAVTRRHAALHTIGNLTLLTRHLNPSVSNGPWSEKREALLRHSRLCLNAPLANYVSWDEDAIRKRADDLFAAATALWSRP